MLDIVSHHIAVLHPSKLVLPLGAAPYLKCVAANLEIGDKRRCHIAQYTCLIEKERLAQRPHVNRRKGTPRDSLHDVRIPHDSSRSV